jgi:hypothetical protein
MNQVHFLRADACHDDEPQGQELGRQELRIWQSNLVAPLCFEYPDNRIRIGK